MITTQIWNSFYSQLFGFVIKRVKNEEVAKDILQDVFIKIHNNIDSLEDDSKITSWVYQITRNVINDYFRSLHPTEEIESHEIASIDKTDDELSVCLHCLIDDLPKEYKRAIFLSEVKGISQMEVAKMLKISYTATKSRIQRGRKILKEKLLNCSPDNVVLGTEECKGKNAERFSE